MTYNKPHTCKVCNLIFWCLYICIKSSIMIINVPSVIPKVSSCLTNPRHWYVFSGYKLVSRFFLKKWHKWNHMSCILSGSREESGFFHIPQFFRSAPLISKCMFLVGLFTICIYSFFCRFKSAHLYLVVCFLVIKFWEFYMR